MVNAMVNTIFSRYQDETVAEVVLFDRHAIWFQGQLFCIEEHVDPMPVTDEKQDSNRKMEKDCNIRWCHSGRSAT